MDDILERNEQIKTMRADGYSYAEIAKMFGITRQRVYKIVVGNNKTVSGLHLNRKSYVVVFDKDFYRTLKIEIIKRDIRSLSALIRELLSEWLKAQKGGEK